MEVSIVITAYNVEKWVKDAINSVLNQTYKNLEVVVVDDCSTDNTPNILKECAAQDSRVKITTHKQNMGAGQARKTGITNSKGEYILLLDGDDWLDENFIEELVKEAELTGADIVSGGISVNHENGVIDTTSYGRVICEGIDKVNRFWGERIVFMNNKLIKRTIHEKVPYCTRRYIEDTPVIIPQLYYANKVAYIPNCGYHYRMNNSSLTHTSSAFKTCIFRILCTQDLLNFFEKENKEYLNTIPLGITYPQLLRQLKAINPTPEMIAEYQKEWNEATLYLINKLQ